MFQISRFITRRFVAYCIILFFFFFTSALHAQYNNYESIRSFDTSIVVNTDSTIDVTEKIEYDFGTEQKRGIYREIALSKASGTIRTLEIDTISVTDEEGVPYATYISESSIRIGDPNRTISGVHTYVIRYRASNAIGYFDAYDEIYWNSTGHEWNVPILNAQTRVLLPGKIDIANLNIASYCGLFGASTPCTNSIPVYDSQSDMTEIVFEMNLENNYLIGKGMTVAVGFPKGIVAEEKLFWYENPQTYIMIAWVIGIVWILILLKLIFVRFISEYNKKKRSIVTTFEPPEGMCPSEVGYIYNWFTGTGTMLSADILYLASLGYIEIENKSLSNVDPVRRSKISDAVVKIILLLLVVNTVIHFAVFDLLIIAFFYYKRNKIKNFIFRFRNPMQFSIKRKEGGDTSRIPPKLVLLYELISKKDETLTLEKIAEQNYYEKFNTYITLKKRTETSPVPFDFRIVLFAIIFLFFRSGIYLAIEGSTIIPLESIVVIDIFFLGILINKVISFIIAWRLSKMTELWYTIAGLHRYIRIAEKDRIDFHSDPHKAQQHFSHLLPYAVALGLQEKWIAVFSGLIVTPPGWYNGVSVTTLSMSIGAFSGSLYSTSRAGEPMSSGNGSSSRSSGSSGRGSSGRGGGGGGGGSW